MTIRKERSVPRLGRLLVVVLGALLLAGSILLAVLEWQRRRHVAAAEGETFDGPGITLSADELTEKYRDPAACAELLADVRTYFDRLRERFFHLAHTRKARLTEFDANGHETAVMEITDRVWFDGYKEVKEQIDRRQRLGKPFPFDPDTLKTEHPNRRAAHPFSHDTPAGLYRYSLEGVDQVHERPALRIHFEPISPVERSFKGRAWVDASAHQPLRLQGSLVKTPLLVDRFEMRVEYGLSENGHNQVRHVRIDVAGGFAFVSRHYRIESELSDYRERDK
jgi:hypothetical protein